MQKIEMWPEVSQAAEQNKRELLLDGDNVSQRITENGLDEGIFKLKSLNFLRISNTCLKAVDPLIAQLSEKLTNLDLHQNHLETLPDELGNLSNLKLLDLSGNQLCEIPDAVCKLSTLLTLNLSNNQLVSIPDVSGNSNLHELFVTNNQLEALPPGLTTLEQLLVIQADHNQIKELPDTIHKVTHLKSLHLSDNLLTDLPLSLVLLDKLKVLDLRGNKFSDRRLHKLANVDQTQPKGVFKYLKPLYDKQAGDSSKGKKGHKSSEGGDGEEDNEDFIQVHNFIDSSIYAELL